MKPRGPLTTVLTLLLNRFESLNLWTPSYQNSMNFQSMNRIDNRLAVSFNSHSPIFQKESNIRMDDCIFL